MDEALRTTFRFKPQEAHFAALLRRPASDESAALCELTGYDDLTHAPAATLLHALVEAGMAAVRVKAEEGSYRRLAEHLATDQESKAWRESRRARAARRHRQADAA